MRFSFIKNKKSRPGMALFLCAMLTLGACSDWLDLKPYDGVTEGDYWQTKEDVFAVLSGCYSSMLNQTLVTNMFYWGELRGDLITVSSQAGGDATNVVRGEITPENKIVKWNEFYTTISYCNKLIEFAPLVLERDFTFTQELCGQYIAEATAIRSLMYFYLVRSFSDVPFITFATNNDQQDYNLPKTAGPAVLDSLVDHLGKVIDRLSPDLQDAAANKGRMTRYVALTLLADIQLWRGNNAACINYCNQVLAGPYALIVPSETDYTINPVYGPLDPINPIDTVNVMTQAYKNRLFEGLYLEPEASPEIIFHLPYPDTHPSLGDPFYALFHGSSTVAPMTPKTDNLTANVFLPYEYADYFPGAMDVRGNGFSFKNNYVWKWVGMNLMDNTMRTQRLYPKWIIYRLADVMLMKAEALTRMNRDNQAGLLEAYNLVKQIRWRNSAVDTETVSTTVVEGDVTYTTIDAEGLEQLILDERAREFIGEGKRWYDVLRFALHAGDIEAGNKYLMSLASTGAPADRIMGMREKYRNRNFLYWPIHIDELETNKNLTQNPFYLQNSTL
jgi:hypothetical protein